MVGTPPEFTLYLGPTPSYNYIGETLLELVVAYSDYGELRYRRDGAWGVEVQDGADRILTSRESAHMRWTENHRPGQPFWVLPNDVVRWLWQGVSLASLRRQQISREAFHRDLNQYRVWRNVGQDEYIWKDSQNRQASVQVYVPWDATLGHAEGYQLLQACPFWEANAIFEPLVFSMRLRQWVMTGLPGAEFVEVPLGAARWLQDQVVRATAPPIQLSSSARPLYSAP